MDDENLDRVDHALIDMAQQLSDAYEGDAHAGSLPAIVGVMTFGCGHSIFSITSTELIPDAGIGRALIEIGQKILNRCSAEAAEMAPDELAAMLEGIDTDPGN